MTGAMTAATIGALTPSSPGGRLTLGVAAVCAMLAVGGCAGPSADLYAKRGGARGAVGWKEDGKATFYAPRLAGHRTANGEIYDPQKLTAAHPVLPFGTKVAVERTDVDLPAVVVRINDRCAAGKKIIDLSEAAAHRLNMTKIGIVPVHLRVISASH
jgi:rare lipoprotein A